MPPSPPPRPVELDEDLTASACALIPGARVVVQQDRFWLDDGQGLRDLGGDRREAAAQLVEYFEFLRGTLFTNPAHGSPCSSCNYAYTEHGKVARCGDCWAQQLAASR